MKKLFAILAIAAVMVSCGNKKKDEKKPEGDSTATSTTTPTTTDPTTTTSIAGVPTFSDPEVQKFANDYAAFLAEYRTAMKDPAKLAELSKGMQDWATRSQEIGLKLASNPDEAMAWAQWVLANTKDLIPDMPDMPDMK